MNKTKKARKAKKTDGVQKPAKMERLGVLWSSEEKHPGISMNNFRIMTSQGHIFRSTSDARAVFCRSLALEFEPIFKELACVMKSKKVSTATIDLYQHAEKSLLQRGVRV